MMLLSFFISFFLCDLIANHEVKAYIQIDFQNNYHRTITLWYSSNLQPFGSQQRQTGKYGAVALL